ncbi:innexin inx2-like [Arctopsyche grandis]|uniref:innexin inx2-like n=1 Tax=Arctopsyche grandis TaxID=121162 RepID=UPI00406D7B84
MADILSVYKPISMINKFRNITLDNSVFQLHSKVTVSILLVSAILVSSKQFFGEPIKCISDKEKLTDALNAYCWIHGTYTLRNSVNPKIVGKNAVSMGVGPHTKHDEEVYYMYYQWVCILLLIQAIMFYIPNYIWRILEGGRLASLTNELDTALLGPDTWNDIRKRNLVQYFIDMNGHNFYAFRFALCELLNFLNVVFQIFVLDSFLGGTFNDYGPAVASFFYHPDIAGSDDPMAFAFPKVTKCSFKSFGSSGTLQNLDLLCILPLNIINEKIFALLWFWFIILAILSAIAVLYRIIAFSCPCARSYSILGQTRLLSRFQILNLVAKFNVGDWFLLNQLAKNLNPMVFKDLIIELEREFNKKTALV